MKLGLEILYAKPEKKGGVETTWKRDLAKELRERYWIAAGNAGTGGRSAGLNLAVSVRFDRELLGRERNEAGDGFRYVFKTGTCGAGGRFEWVEVTEVFEGVNPQGIESFMQLQNGGDAKGFDSEMFLSNLRMGIPRRAQQRRAADAVLKAIDRKMSKLSYEDMLNTYGYGTLIVGLPLWFAPLPLNPGRIENVIDDFMTRVRLGLDGLKSRLRRRRCPFWRVLVVWNASMESLREWQAKTLLTTYEDPATYKNLESAVLAPGLLPKMPKALDALEKAMCDGSSAEGTGFVLRLDIAQPQKRGRRIQIGGATGQLIEAVEGRTEGEKDVGRWASIWIWARVWFWMKLLAILRFCRVHGVADLGRWIGARLAPARRVARFSKRRRAKRLYRASRMCRH